MFSFIKAERVSNRISKYYTLQCTFINIFDCIMFSYTNIFKMAAQLLTLQK